MTEKQLKNDFFANGLCFHCRMAKTELHEFKQFHSETEALWIKKDKELQKKINGILKEYSEEHHQDIIEGHSWNLHQNQYKYPNIHRESIIIAIYIFLEAQLNQLCDIISESINIKIKRKDLDGKGIEKAFLYLSKVADFDLSKMGREMPYIKNVNALRNHIVHSGGSLPETADHKLNKFVSQNSNLSGSPGGCVSLNSDFIKEFIELLIDFFEKLDEEVQAFISRAIAC